MVLLGFMLKTSDVIKVCFYHSCFGLCGYVMHLSTLYIRKLRCEPFLATSDILKCMSISVSVAKPLVVDGSAKSHELSLAYDQNSLQILEPPLVVQEFVNHGILISICAFLITHLLLE